MDFTNICEKALEYSKQSCISSIVKIKDGFIFGFCDNRGNDLFINPVYVSDNGTKVKSYFPMDHKDEILYQIVIPDDFTPKK